MDNLYPQAILEPVKECLEQLDELSATTRARNLSTFEYRAAERLLQLLVESAIGVARQWLKSLDKSPSFRRLPMLFQTVATAGYQRRRTSKLEENHRLAQCLGA